MALTIAPSPFGTLSVTVQDTLGVMTVSTVATAPAVLTMQLGVPGPKGDTGNTGANGIGVVAGGTTGQSLVKISDTDYATNWASMLPLTGGTISYTDANDNVKQIGLFAGDIWCGESNEGLYSFKTHIGTGGVIPQTSIKGLFNVDQITFPDSSTQASAFIPSNYLTASSIASTYLSQSSAASTYQPISGMSSYLTTSSAASTYLSQASAASSYLPLTGGGYIFNVTSGGETETASSYSLSFDPNEETVSLKLKSERDSSFIELLSSNVDGNKLKFSNGVELNPSFLKFADSSTQASAFIPSNYLTASSIASTYLSQSSAASTYLSQTSAASTYFPIPTGLATDYLNGTGVPVTFPTVTSVGKITQLVRNNTGSTITKGSVVYINGSVGNDPSVALAQANTEAASAHTIGLAEADILNNTTGVIVTTGLLEGLNTNSFTAGDELYLSPTVAGGYTLTKPEAPNHYVKLGTIIRSHPVTGSIRVMISNGGELNELSDVLLGTLANNELMVYESSTQLWKNKSVTTAIGYAPANLANYTYATDAQAIAGTSASTVMSPATALTASMHPEIYLIDATNFGSTVTGTGTASVSGSTNSVATGLTSGSTAMRNARQSTTANFSKGTDRGIIDFSKQIILSGSSMIEQPQANTIQRFSLGKSGTGTGDLSTMGIGWKKSGTGVIQLMVHNGTTLTISTNGTFTPTTRINFDWKIVSDGSGNATLYVNDTSVATTTGAPTGQTGVTANAFALETECSATLTNTNILYVSNIKAFFGR